MGPWCRESQSRRVGSTVRLPLPPSKLKSPGCWAAPTVISSFAPFAVALSWTARKPLKLSGSLMVGNVAAASGRPALPPKTDNATTQDTNNLLQFMEITVF